jgi:WD40 repeat protein
MDKPKRQPQPQPEAQPQPDYQLGFEHLIVEDKPKGKPKPKAQPHPARRRLVLMVALVMAALVIMSGLVIWIAPVRSPASLTTAGRLSNAEQAVLIGSASRALPLGWVNVPVNSQKLLWSPDGKTLAVGGEQSPLQLYQAANSEAPPLTMKTAANARLIAFSPDGRRIAGLLAARKGIAVWDTATGEQVAQADYPEDAAAALAFTPQGDIVALGWGTRLIFRWDMRGDPQRIGLTDAPEVVGSLAISPDGKRIAGSDDASHLWLWNAETGLALHRWFGESDGNATVVAFSPDGKVLSSGDVWGFVKTWNVERQNNLFGNKFHTTGVTTLAFSPDGAFIASGVGGYSPAPSVDDSVRLWRWNTQTTQQYVDVLRGHRLPVYSIAFSPDGARLAVLLQGTPEDQTAPQAHLWLWDIHMLSSAP